MLERIPSGIPGLDQLLHGGLIKNSVISVLGGSGTGKSIMALQFALRGLIRGEHVLYLSLEERPQKLIQEALALGLDKFRDFSGLEHMFHYISGERMVDFFKDVLPQMASNLEKNIKVHTRVVIDPITPLLWEIGNQRDQRKLLVESYDLLRRLGTVWQSVEESSALSGLTVKDADFSVPIYLSDTVLYTQNIHIGGPFSRTVRIVKSRGTAHVEGLHPIRFVHGAGLVIQAPFISTPSESTSKKTHEAQRQIHLALQTARKLPASDEVSNLISQLEIMKKHWSPEYGDPTPILKVLLEEFGIA